MPLTRGRASPAQFHKFCLALKSKSSGAPITAKDSPFCPSAGLSSAPSPGLTAAAGSPRIGRTSIARASLSCASLQSASCSESSAIQSELCGQTLREGRTDAKDCVLIAQPEDYPEASRECARKGRDLRVAHLHLRN